MLKGPNGGAVKGREVRECPLYIRCLVHARRTRQTEAAVAPRHCRDRAQILGRQWRREGSQRSANPDLRVLGCGDRAVAELHALVIPIIPIIGANLKLL